MGKYNYFCRSTIIYKIVCMVLYTTVYFLKLGSLFAHDHVKSTVKSLTHVSGDKSSPD